MAFCFGANGLAQIAPEPANPFPSSTGPANPNSQLIRGPDGAFYGTSARGGTEGGGTLFRVSSTGEVSAVASFPPLVDALTNEGSFHCRTVSPIQAHLAQTADGDFVGAADNGAVLENGILFDAGIIYRVHPANASVVPVHGFRRIPLDRFGQGGTDESAPLGGMLADASGNVFGSTTGSTGFRPQPVVFRIGPDGYRAIAVPNPRGPLAFGEDGTLWGTTGGGSVFKADFNAGFQGGFQTVATLASAANGLVRGPDGNFYGTTSEGGAFGGGTVFRITPAGVVTTLGNFDTNTGTTPGGALVVTDDLTIYGVTGVTAPSASIPQTVPGKIFKLTPDGTINVLADPGARLAGGLVAVGDGSFLGAMHDGGKANCGAIYRISAAGEFTILTEFDGPGILEPDGLVRTPNGTFYGTTRKSGTENKGALFKISPTGEFTLLASFNDTTGSEPGGIVVDGQGVIRGVARLGGVDGGGTIFKYLPGGSLTVIHSLPLNGTIGHLLMHSDGNFYGVTRGGGANQAGSVYRLTPEDEFTTLYSFPNSPTARQPHNGLVEVPGGDMLGIMWSDSVHAEQAYRVTRGGALGVLGSLAGVQAGEVVAPLVRGPEGDYYGINATTGQGRMFSVGLDGSVKTRAWVVELTRTPVVVPSDGRIYFATKSGSVYRAPVNTYPYVKQVLELPGANVALPTVGFEENESLVGLVGGVIFRFPLELPVVTAPAVLLNATSARLSGTVLTDLPASVYFEYGPTTAYGSTTPMQSLGSATEDQSFAAEVSGLTTNTLYHFRAVAVTDRATHYGIDRRFTPVFREPLIVTDVVSGVTSAGAILNGAAVTGGSPATVSFEYGTSISYGSATPPQTIPADADQHFQAALSALPEKTTFHVRAVFTADGVTRFGADATFTTLADPPAAVTETTSKVTGSSAVLQGTAFSPRETATVHFEYGPTPAAEISTPAQVIPPSASAQAFTSAISGLQPNTTYYFRAVVTIGSVVTRGMQLAFRPTTPGDPPPSVTGEPTDVTSTGAVLHGTAFSSSESATVRFEYGATTVGDLVTPFQVIAPSATAQPFEATIAELQADATYYYRAVVIIGQAVFKGAQIAFRAAPNYFPQLAGMHAPVVQDASGALVGRLRVALSGTRQFSASLNVNGTTWLFHNAFPLTGNFTTTLDEPGKPVLNLQLDLDTFSEQGELAGTVTVDGVSFSLVPEPKVPFSQIPSLRGRWTLLLSPEATEEIVPRGTGWATLNAAKNGSVRLVGSLADGTRFSSGQSLRNTDRLPVFARLYRGKGGLDGDLNLADGHLNGTLRWQKRAKPGSSFPGGFDLFLEAIGSPYTVPERGNRMLNYTIPSAAEANLSLLSNDAAPPNVFRLGIGTGDAVTILEGSKDLQLKLHRQSGKMTGSFLGQDRKRTRFSGAVLQDLNYGAGFFIDSAGSGSVELSPR